MAFPGFPQFGSKERLRRLFLSDCQVASVQVVQCLRHHSLFLCWTVNATLRPEASDSVCGRSDSARGNRGPRPWGCRARSRPTCFFLTRNSPRLNLRYVVSDSPAVVSFDMTSGNVRELSAPGRQAGCEMIESQDIFSDKIDRAMGGVFRLPNSYVLNVREG